MSYVLRFTNPYGERYFFAGLGDSWPHVPTNRLIAETVADVGRAKVFDTIPEALGITEAAGSPAGWEVIPRD